MKVIVDTETDALKGYTKLWCLVVRSYTGELLSVFRNVHEDPAPAKEYLSKVSRWCGHNFIRFDALVLKHFLGIEIKPEDVDDTLIVSRLLDYNREGGHSLSTWGTRFALSKSTWSDFSQWSQELEDRCISDTEINYRLLKYFSKHLASPVWQPALLLEHRTEALMVQVHTNGFNFNVLEANNLLLSLEEQLASLSNTLSILYRPKPVFVKEVLPTLTKKGTLNLKDFYWETSRDLSSYSPLCPFSLIDWMPFNPGSSKQRIEILNKAGWKPVNKTKGHLEAERSRDPKVRAKLNHFRVYGWQTDEDNLLTLPEDAPEAPRKLALWLLLRARTLSLKEWLASVEPSQGVPGATEGRIHPTIQGIGAWTGRKSHLNPNSANIPALMTRHGKVQPYGREMRALWNVRKGWRLVGTDCDSAQLRVFAHLINKLELIKSIETGNKLEKTDPHNLNFRLLAPICIGREPAKTLLYALFLGAKDRRIMEILDCTLAESKEVQARMSRAYPEWEELKAGRLLEETRRGYLQGLDGRYVKIPSDRDYLALSGHLQNGESVIMKTANLIWHDKLTRERIPFLQVNDVHDEWQTEVLDEDGLPEYVGKVQCQSLAEAGERLKLNIKIAGECKFGYNWAETH